MAQAPPKELLAYLKPYDLAIRELALAMREFAIGEMAPCHEYVLDTSYTVAIGFSPTERVIRDGVCVIAVYPAHVNLAFHRGAELDDPSLLLQGAGKSMRHVKITSEADLSHPGIRELIQQARELPGVPAADPNQKPRVITGIKGEMRKKRFNVRRNG